MTTSPSIPPTDPDPSCDPTGIAPEEQAAFFARLEAELARADITPEPAWKARTLGTLVLNPRTYRAVVSGCVATLLAAGSWIGYSWQQAQRPPEALHLPPGYLLISTPDGRLMAVMDRQLAADDQEQLRADALEELQMLLAEQSGSYPADDLAVPASLTYP
ncbi:MAG: hypothetical protein GEEBNDBF_01789 [bacterium]|nr:hypothetical protein [bacterium]